MKKKLNEKIERIQIHVGCLQKRITHWRFHLAGIWREFIPRWIRKRRPYPKST